MVRKWIYTVLLLLLIKEIKEMSIKIATQNFLKTNIQKFA